MALAHEILMEGVTAIMLARVVPVGEITLRFLVA
jgi:hypothetical protein